MPRDERDMGKVGCIYGFFFFYFCSLFVDPPRVHYWIRNLLAGSQPTLNVYFNYTVKYYFFAASLSSHLDLYVCVIPPAPARMMRNESNFCYNNRKGWTACWGFTMPDDGTLPLPAEPTPNQKTRIGTNKSKINLEIALQSTDHANQTWWLISKLEAMPTRVGSLISPFFAIPI